MDPEEKKEKENLAKNIMEMKGEGVDIITDNDGPIQESQTSKPSPVNTKPAPTGDAVASFRPNNAPNARMVTDKIPNVIQKLDESEQQKKQTAYNNAPVKSGVEDKLNAKSNRLISSVPIMSQEEVDRILEGDSDVVAQRNANAQPYNATNKNPINDPSIKALRTYKTDAEEAIKNERISVVNIAVSENARKVVRNETIDTKRVENEKKGRFGVFSIILSFVFIASGIGAAYFVFISLPKTPDNTEPLKSAYSIANEDNVKEFTLSALYDPIENYGKALESLPKNKNGSVTRFKPIEEVGGIKSELGPSDFWGKVSFPIPGRLLRSITSFVLGTYTEGNKVPFIILSLSSFENGFAGMLEWERDMGRELLPIINISHNINIDGATFYDKVIKNKDSRVLTTIDGQGILFYTFTNNGTIVITTEQKTLETLIDRMVTTRVIR